MMDDGEPLWLQCCPHWLQKQPAVLQVADCYYWAETSNLNIFYSPGKHSMPVRLREAIKAYAAGLQDGMDERIKNEKR